MPRRRLTGQRGVAVLFRAGLSTLVEAVKRVEAEAKKQPAGNVRRLEMTLRYQLARADFS
jgi:hypothetical protein